jgi:hypothetical protein
VRHPKARRSGRHDAGRPASYSDQFRTRYRGFAYLYWLRFGYFIGEDSRIDGFTALGSHNHRRSSLFAELALDEVDDIDDELDELP